MPVSDPRFPETTYGPACLYWYHVLTDPWGGTLCRHESCDEILRGCTAASKEYLRFIGSRNLEGPALVPCSRWGRPKVRRKSLRVVMGRSEALPGYAACRNTT